MAIYSKPEPGKPTLIEIAGQMLELRYTLRTLKALDTEHGISVFKGEGLGAAMQDPARMAILLTYGLRTRNPEVTQEWVEDNVDASMLLDLSPMLAYATTGRWIDVNKVLDAALPNAVRPSLETGSTSGPSGVTILG